MVRRRAIRLYFLYELNEAFDRALQERPSGLLPLAADDVLGHEDDDARAHPSFQ